MKSINLIPRKPFLEQWLIPLIAGLLSLYVIAGFAMMWAAWSAETGHRANVEEIEALRQDMRALREDRAPDPAQARFEKFQEVVGALENRRYDWMSAIASFVGPLPETARIVGAAFLPEDAVMNLETEFKSLADAARFIGGLRTNELFANVRVAAIQLTEAALPPEVEAPSAAAASPTPQQYELSSDDPALRELEWVIMRQALSQRYGVQLPVEPPETSIRDFPELEDAFTSSEIEAAREAVRQSHPINKDTLVPGTSSPANPLEPPAETKISYYRVTLMIGVAGVAAEQASAVQEGSGAR